MGGIDGGGGSGPWAAPDEPSSPAPPPPQPPVGAPYPPYPPWVPGGPPVTPPAQSRKWAGLVLAVLGLGLAVLGLVLANKSDEPSPRGRTEQAAEDGWARHDVISIAALVTDGERVCSTEGDELFCVDGRDGGEVFTADLPGEATSVTLAGETLVVGADGGVARGDVYGYSIDGDLLWEATGLQDVDIDSFLGLGTAFAAAGDVVVVPLGEYGRDGIVALDGRSGQELWRQSGFSPTEPITVVGDLVSDGQRFYGNAMFVDLDTGAMPRYGIVAVDPASGTPSWQVELDRAVDDAFLREAALVDDGSAVALGLYGEGSETIVVDPATGAVRWRVPMDTDWGDVAFLDDVTAVVDGLVLRGYDREGVEVWASDLPSSRRDESDRVRSPDLVVAGGRLYALADSDLLVVDPADGGTEVVLPGHHPLAVVAVEDYLVVAGLGWQAVPLDALP